MPPRRHFFRSLSPELRQPTLGGLLTVFPPRPGPRPQSVEQRRQEPSGSRYMIGGVNKIMVLEMFRSYRNNFV
jgi:hypothetical protein